MRGLLRTVATVACLGAIALGAGAGYRIKPGDSLSTIGRRHGVSVGELVAANGIADPHRIVAGRDLVIPAKAATAPAAPTPAGGGPGDVSGRYPTRLRDAPERLALVPHFERWAAANKVPLDLLMAMTWVESGWQNHVVSSVGARGIGQLMPATVDFVRTSLIGEPRLDPADAEDNIRMSARYLRWLLQRADGDVEVALAGYYQGPASVRRNGIKAVSKVYIAAVQALRPAFA